jgi:hypothetical protein
MFGLLFPSQNKDAIYPALSSLACHGLFTHKVCILLLLWLYIMVASLAMFVLLLVVLTSFVNYLPMFPKLLLSWNAFGLEKA